MTDDELDRHARAILACAPQVPEGWTCKEARHFLRLAVDAAVREERGKTNDLAEACATRENLLAEAERILTAVQEVASLHDPVDAFGWNPTMKDVDRFLATGKNTTRTKFAAAIRGATS